MNDGFDEKQDLSQGPSDTPSLGVRLTVRQTAIHRNLESIGPEIAAFYKGGIQILHENELEITPYLLAHVAREIDGGLRDILSSDEEKESIQKQVTNEVLTKLGNYSDLKDRKGHIASILAALGIGDVHALFGIGDVRARLAVRWINVATQFHKFVHRHGAWKLPRGREDFENLWFEFEDLVEDLVGTYLKLLSRLDRILEYGEPTKEIRDTLHNLLGSEARRAYFFGKLEFPTWLEPLKEDGWFDPENSPTPQQYRDQDGHYYPSWYALEYVGRVADCTEKHPCDETTNCLVSIVDAIINHTDETGERIRNDYTDWRILRIIGTFPIAQIKRRHITFMDTALKSGWPRMLAAREVTQTILPKLLDADAKELTLALLKVIVDAQVINDQIIADMGRPQLKEAFEKHTQDLMILYGHDTVAAAKQRCDQINIEKIEQLWIESNPGEISSGPIEVCLDMSNAQIAEYLDDFKEKVNWSGPYGKRLGETLRQCVTANPERFADNLQPFQEIHNLYQYFILLGFARAWRDKKRFDWERLLDFIDQILSSEQFWLKQQGTDLDYRNLVLSATAHLLISGTGDETHAFDPQLLPLAERILLILVKKAQPSVATLGNFPTTTIENSAKAKVFTAIMSYSLQFARINGSKQEIRWSQTIKDDFTKRLNRNVEPFDEFSFALGKYLRYLSYLDWEWVTSNINHIFSQEDEDHWQVAFSGYLLSSEISPSLYRLLKENGSYQKALNTGSVGKQRLRTLVNHICIGWIEEWETLDDEESLIYQLINSNNPDFLFALIHFFSRYRGTLSKKAELKIMPTWSAMFEILSQNSDITEYQSVLGSLAEWLSLIDTIDAKVLKWVKLSTKYIDRSPQPVNLELFVQALLKNAPERPKEIGEIYLEIPENTLSRLCPGMPEITQTIGILYNKQHKEIADAICNRFGEVGFNFLKELYEKHQC